MIDTGDTFSERRPLGHQIRGTSFTDGDGNTTMADAFFVCTEMGHFPPEVLANIHRQDRADPPLDTCGYHDLGR